MLRTRPNYLGRRRPFDSTRAALLGGGIGVASDSFRQRAGLASTDGFAGYGDGLAWTTQSGTIVCSNGIIKATSGGIATIDPTVVDSWRVRFFIATALTGNLNSFAFRFADTSNYLRLTIATSGSQFQTVIATTATSIGVGVSGVTPAQGDEIMVTVSGNSLSAQIFRAGIATGTAASATNSTGAGLTPMGFRFADTTVGFAGLTVRRL